MDHDLVSLYILQNTTIWWLVVALQNPTASHSTKATPQKISGET